MNSAQRSWAASPLTWTAFMVSGAIATASSPGLPSHSKAAPFQAGRHTCTGPGSALRRGETAVEIGHGGPGARGDVCPFDRRPSGSTIRPRRSCGRSTASNEAWGWPRTGICTSGEPGRHHRQAVLPPVHSMIASPVSEVTPTRFSPCHNSAPATGDPTSSRTETSKGVAPVARPQPAQAAQTRERATSSRNNSLRDKMREPTGRPADQPRA